MEATEDIADEPTTDRNARTEQFAGKENAVIEAAGATHPGRLRTRNEDAFEILADVGLVLVADGLGGHPAGDIASRMAVQEVADYLRSTMDHLSRAIQHANREIHVAGRRFPVTAGMGTTIAALLVVRGFAIVAHVGDSRVYLLREGQLVQVTEDHSRAAEHARFHGPNTHRRAPQDGALTRCLGAWPRVDVTISALRRAPGDMFLVCSDGLWNAVSDEMMQHVLLNTADAGEAADLLVEEANAAGGPDNITAIVVRPIAAEGRSSRPPE